MHNYIEDRLKARKPRASGDDPKPDLIVERILP